MKDAFPVEGRTLLMSAAGRVAILVMRAGRRMRSRHLRFKDEHEALDWCLKHQAGFVLSPRPQKTHLN